MMIDYREETSISERFYVLKDIYVKLLQKPTGG